MNIPKEFLYSASHEWIKLGGDGTAVVGLTDYAQDALGDIVFVNLPVVGDSFAAEDVFADVESVKAVSDIYCPLEGTVLEVNEQLEEQPELINSDPYGAWLAKLSDIGDTSGLLSAEQYEAVIANA